MQKEPLGVVEVNGFGMNQRNSLEQNDYIYSHS